MPGVVERDHRRVPLHGADVDRLVRRTGDRDHQTGGARLIDQHVFRADDVFESFDDDGLDREAARCRCRLLLGVERPGLVFVGAGLEFEAARFEDQVPSAATAGV